MLIRYMDGSRTFIKEISELFYENNNGLHVYCEEIGLHVVAEGPNIPDFDKFVSTHLPVIPLCPPIFKECKEQSFVLTKTDVYDWLSGLSLEQAKEIACDRPVLFNVLLRRDAEQLSVFGLVLRDMITAMKPAKSNTDMRFAEWYFLIEFMDWYGKQNHESLPVGYSAVWDMAKSENYAELIDVGKEMLVAAMKSANPFG